MKSQYLGKTTKNICHRVIVILLDSFICLK